MPLDHSRVRFRPSGLLINVSHSTRRSERTRADADAGCVDEGVVLRGQRRKSFKETRNPVDLRSTNGVYQVNVKPIGERVLIAPVKEAEKTTGGIYLPDSAREGKKKGTVVAIGERDDGKPMPVKKGDVILYGGYSHEEFEIDGKEYVIVELKDVAAKIE